MLIWGQIVFDPPMGAGAVVWLMGLAVAACLVVYGWKAAGILSGGQRVGLAMLRLVAVGGLAWMLAGPGIWEVGERKGLTRVILLVDRSASMGERDVQRAGQWQRISRWEAVNQTWLEEKFLVRLAERAEVGVCSFDQEVQFGAAWEVRGAGPEGRASRLFEALRRLTGQGAEGLVGEEGVIVVLSDGHDTEQVEDPELIRGLARGRWRVFAVPVGRAESEADLAVWAWPSSDRVYCGQVVEIGVQISRRGTEQDETRVQLWEGQALREERRVSFRAGASAVGTSFLVRPEAEGEQEISQRVYRVEVDGLEQEVDQENNRAWVFIQVVREPVRVGLVEGRAGWDSAFVGRALRADRRIALSSFQAVGKAGVIRVEPETGGEWEGSDPEAVDLSRFDVVILGQGCERFFPGQEAEKLVDFVRRGGGLILARGKAFQGDSPEGRRAGEIVSVVEPVRWLERQWRRGRMVVREEGWEFLGLLEEDKYPRTDVRGLPEKIWGEDEGHPGTDVPGSPGRKIVEGWSGWLHKVQLRGDAQVLLGQVGLEAEESWPVVVWGAAGKGTVVVVTGEGLWRWAMEGIEESGGLGYGEFWRRLAYQLAGQKDRLAGQRVWLSVDRCQVQVGGRVWVQVDCQGQIRGEDLSVRLEGPEGSSEALKLRVGEDAEGRYVVWFEADMPGVYRVHLEGAEQGWSGQTVGVAAGWGGLEMLDRSARPEVLKRVVEASGGRCLGLEDREEFLRELDQIQAAERSEGRLRYVYDSPLALVCVVLGLGGEWLWRRRRGMV